MATRDVAETSSLTGKVAGSRFEGVDSAPLYIYLIFTKQKRPPPFLMRAQRLRVYFDNLIGTIKHTIYYY